VCFARSLALSFSVSVSLSLSRARGITPALRALPGPCCVYPARFPSRPLLSSKRT
jgi:hypothetical protein